MWTRPSEQLRRFLGRYGEPSSSFDIMLALTNVTGGPVSTVYPVPTMRPVPPTIRPSLTTVVAIVVVVVAIVVVGVVFTPPSPSCRPR